MALHSAIKGKLIAVIGDEDTCVGFLLGGIGEINKNRHPNFLVVDKSRLFDPFLNHFVFNNVIVYDKLPLQIQLYQKLKNASKDL